MANYVAHYQKKLDTLARKRLDLIRLLGRHGTEHEVVAAAEEVRAAQRRALEAKRAQVPPCDANSDRLRAIDEEIAACLRRSAAEIIASCKQRRSGGK
jgi:hypothetical protein